VRVVIADDEVLLREGLARLLREVDISVAGLASDPQSLARMVALEQPDAAIVDIKMPPTHTDEGLVAAVDIRRCHPRVGVVLLSHYLDSRFAVSLLEEHAGGVGYLLKERVADVQVLTDALDRVAAGGSVVDRAVVTQMMARKRNAGQLDSLSEREREVLALMAEGLSNAALSDRLVLSGKTVEHHVRHIFTKLDLDDSPSQHRRVLAVLAWLRAVS
jgi:DNA-binding NarL/FixJ family response regulator